ncbi:T9SS type A sorting domain-containing protein [Foetidibacter luteolus]|uniref:T9SS type A sorting domain-containing protein n=1 Tax=Foetidibacter luteolus TaxID=2608880 RepID=UPI00129AC861|nr:T9SS type A sorting domain-containing protein [Foetidibacter luteolus]
MKSIILFKRFILLYVCMIAVTQLPGQVFKTTFPYTGADQTWVVPNGVTKIVVKAWGAGGAGGNYIFNDVGGGGGFAMDTLNVTPGEVLTIITGGGGQPGAGVGAYGGGGPKSCGGGGRGGGRSGVRNSSDIELITAGAGGGGGGAGAPENVGGGGGGGLTGEASHWPGFDGGPGTQTAGGAGGANPDRPDADGGAGGSYYGGAGACVDNGLGGSGGGGYYGGGGGTDVGDGAGGGGSSYISASGTTIGAVGITPANAADEDYTGNVASGGAYATAGGDGLVVIIYSLPVAQLSLSFLKPTISNKWVQDNAAAITKYATSEISISTNPVTAGLIINCAITGAAPSTTDKGSLVSASGVATSQAEDLGNGNYRIFYRAKQEIAANKCATDEYLQPQTVFAECTVNNGTPGNGSVSVVSRFNYLVYNVQEYNNAIAYAKRKYAVTFPAGSTQTYTTATQVGGVTLDAWTDVSGRVFLTLSTLVNENVCAGTLVRENVIARKGAVSISQLILGRTIYNLLGNFALFSPSLRNLVLHWATVELEAYNKELSVSTTICLDNTAHTKLLSDIQYYQNIRNTFAVTLLAASGPMQVKEAGKKMPANNLLYPNPSKGALTLRYNNALQGKMVLRVFDMAGRVVFTRTDAGFKGENLYRINLPNLHPGIYYLEVNGNKQELIKFILQK